MSLRSLINLRIVLSVILMVVLSAVIAIWQVRNTVENEVLSSIKLATQMIEFGFNQLPESGKNSEQWLENFSTIQPTRHLQISLKDSPVPHKYSLDSIALDNEVSLPPKWFIDAVMIDSLTMHYDMKMADGTIQTIVITANPLDEITEAWGETISYFRALLLLIFAIFITVNLVFNSMLRTVNTILSGLKRLEKGEYGLLLPSFKISEFDAIANQVNGMSLALKKAQDSNQALALHTMQIQETERQTMSRELHDEMGQSLTAIKAMAVTCKQPSSNVADLANSIIDICNHLSGVVRSMMRTLHPLSLSELGLGATLTDLVSEWQRRSPQIRFDLDYDEKLDDLSDSITIHVYRIVQECLTNVVRHANASEVTVLVNKHATQVSVTVADNGVGIQKTGHGFGVLGMRERAENLGGKFRMESEPSNGVSVIVQLPFMED